MSKEARKAYVTPAIETLDSSEIVDLLGPVQGYGPGSGTIGGGVSGGSQGLDPASAITPGGTNFGR